MGGGGGVLPVDGKKSKRFLELLVLILSQTIIIARVGKRSMCMYVCWCFSLKKKNELVHLCKKEYFCTIQFDMVKKKGRSNLCMDWVI